MKTSRAPAADPTKILTRRELAAVLFDLKAKSVRSKNARLNLIVFRLACCCGLRATEIAKLQMADVAAWRAVRANVGPTDPFVASDQPGREAKVFSRHTLRKRFRTACKLLGPERLESLTIHHGRHTFISHALAGGRTLAEVRDAVGHGNVSITSGYLHVAVDNDSVGILFD